MDILFLSPADWEGPRGRFQHIAQRLAEHNRVIYADGLGIRKIESGDWTRILRKALHFMKPNASRLHSDRELFRVAPLAFPGRSSSFLQRVNRWLLSRYLSGQCRKFGFRDPLIWISYPHPDLVPILDRLSRGAVIYDCVDAWSQFQKGHPEIADSEAMLLSRADLVLTTAEPLQKRASLINSNSFLVPNAVDSEPFRLAMEKRGGCPDDMAAIPRPRIGFVGNIAEWVDLELIAGMARIRPDWNFVFVGPLRVDGLPLRAANIHNLGYRPYEAVPSYIAACDVCIMPFVENDLTRCCDPLKLYEYLAAGRPVVTTPIPRAEDFPTGVRIARGIDPFIRAIEASLIDASGDAEARSDSVRGHTWQSRMRQIRKHVQDCLGIDLLPGDPQA